MPENEYTLAHARIGSMRKAQADLTELLRFVDSL